VIDINKYKQNHDNAVTCSIKIETEIDIHIDVKQVVQWQVFGHVTKYNTNKQNIINVSVFRTLGGGVHIVPDFIPRSLCGWPRTSLHLLEKRHNHSIVPFAHLCHMVGKEFVFLSFLYIKLFKLGAEVAFNKSFAVTHE